MSSALALSTWVNSASNSSQGMSITRSWTELPSSSAVLVSALSYILDWNAAPSGGVVELKRGPWYLFRSGTRKPGGAGLRAAIQVGRYAPSALTLGLRERVTSEARWVRVLMREALHAAVHVHDGARDHAGLRRGHEGHEMGDVLRVTEFPGRDVLRGEGELVLHSRVAPLVLL